MDEKSSIRIRRKKKSKKHSGISVDTSKCSMTDENIVTTVNEKENEDIKEIIVKIKKSNKCKTKYNKSKLKVITPSKI